MSDHDSRTDRSSGWHQVNIGHLVMGLALLGLVGVWAIVQTDTVADDDVRWLLPIPWVVAGLVGLAASAITGPRRHAVRQAGWVGEDTAPPTSRPVTPPDETPTTPETPETDTPESDEEKTS